MGKFTSQTGRLAGQKSRRGPDMMTTAFKTFLAGEGADKAQRILMELEGLEYLEQYAKFINYALPRLASAQIEAKADVNIQVKEPDWTTDD